MLLDCSPSFLAHVTCRGLASNNWTGTLPAQWAGANAFPRLQQL